MLFVFRKYRIQRSPVFLDGMLYRPEVLVRVIGPSGDLFLRGLVDSGADTTLFPRSVANAVGLSLEDAPRSPAAGFTGDQLEVVYAEIELEMSQGEERHRWSTAAGFVDYARPELEQTLLGRVGFLDQFTAVFDMKRHQLELTRNS